MYKTITGSLPFSTKVGSFSLKNIHIYLDHMNILFDTCFLIFQSEFENFHFSIFSKLPVVVTLHGRMTENAKKKLLPRLANTFSEWFVFREKCAWYSYFLIFHFCIWTHVVILKLIWEMMFRFMLSRMFHCILVTWYCIQHGNCQHRIYIYHNFTSWKTPHTSLSWVSYGMYNMSIWEKINHVITGHTVRSHK